MGLIPTNSPTNSNLQRVMSNPFAILSNDLVQDEVSEACGEVFLAIHRVDLETDTTRVLHSTLNPGLVGGSYSWQTHLQMYERNYFNPEHAKDLYAFSSDNLKKLIASGRPRLVADLQRCEPHCEEWVSISAYFRTDEHGSPYSYIFLSKSDDSRLMRSILEAYVFEECDYLAYIDIAERSFTPLGNGKTRGFTPNLDTTDFAKTAEIYAETFVVEPDRERFLQNMDLDYIREQLESSKTFTLSFSAQNSDGSSSRKRATFRYQDTAKTTILLMQSDITAAFESEERHKQELQLAIERARIDALTGLLNRKGFEEKVTSSLTRLLRDAEEGGSRQGALLFLDLDNLKAVNDTWGHLVGDELLRNVSEALQFGVRPDDIVGRLGGDEFLVFCPNIKGRDGMAACAERLLRSINSIRLLQDPTLAASCSIGAALIPDDGSEYENLIDIADKRVYEAKRAGKNCAVVE